jgi:hypothetical protein
MDDIRFAYNYFMRANHQKGRLRPWISEDGCLRAPSAAREIVHTHFLLIIKMQFRQMTDASLLLTTIRLENG